MQRVARWSRTLCGLLLVLPPGEQIPAEAQESLNSRLRGDYAFTEIRVCVQGTLTPDNPRVFGDNLQLMVNGSSRTTVSQGTLTFNGDGTGSVPTLEQLQFNHNRTSLGNFPVTQHVFACNGMAYAVNLDGTFTLELSDCPGAAVIGDPDITSELPSVPLRQFGFQFQGRISQGNQVLLLTNSSPNPEGLETTPPAPPFVGERICGRSGTAIKVN